MTKSGKKTQAQRRREKTKARGVTPGLPALTGEVLPPGDDDTAGLAGNTAYDRSFVQRAKDMCGLGATLFDLAQAFGVTTVTINGWMAQHKAFNDVVRVAGEKADDRVEVSLYHRALGYSHRAEKIFCTKDGDIVRAQYTEHVPPDTKAMIFWLMNRRRKTWTLPKSDEDADATGGQIVVKGGLPAPK